MTAHTEGPWSAAETRHNYDTVIRGPKGEPIALALIAGYTKKEGAANTALLAAAPDLLEALSGMLACWRSVCRAQGWEPEHVVEAIRAQEAIAKATREQP